jgi:hypothetical protein
MKRLLSLLLVAVPCLAYLACSAPADYPDGCAARCGTTDYNLPPSDVTCINSGALRCGEPSCDDGTPVAVNLCASNGHAICKNGAEPRCLPDKTRDAGAPDASDAAADASHE